MNSGSKKAPGDEYIEKRTVKKTLVRDYEMPFESRGGRSMSFGSRHDTWTESTFHSMPSGTFVEKQTSAVQTRRTNRQHDHGNGAGKHTPTDQGYTPGPTAPGFRPQTKAFKATYSNPIETVGPVTVRKTAWK